MLTAAGLRPLLREEGKNMRVRILMALSVVVLLSVGAATAAAASKYSASQQLCLNANGTFSTKSSSSFYAPFSKKERVLWTCNSYSDSTVAQALVNSCLGDGGQSARADAPGFVTCWKN
jgi:hypothetical protein